MVAHGFGAYVTHSYMLTRLNLLILRRISEATVSLESAQRLKKGGYAIDQTNRDLMLASLHRVAMKVLELPASERETLYERLKVDLVKGAPGADLHPEAAEEFGKKYLEFLRALVKMIEAGGGATGGRA
jgi:hypothetical protein